MKVAVAIVGVVAGCSDSVTLSITSDRPVPSALDAICVGIADTSPHGGQFGRRYRLEGALASLPQTIRVDPGSAGSALAWVRGDRGGVPVASASTAMRFDSDVDLSLAACAHGSAAAPQPVGAPAGPGGAHLAASEGQGGLVVLALAASDSAALYAERGGLAVRRVPPLAGAPIAVTTADLDGDCDDDAIVATDSGPPIVWMRDHADFIDTGAAVGGAAVRALAVGDVDGDGDSDVITGGGGALALYINDGAGNLTGAPLALTAGGHVTAVSALALADVDGDGFPDLVVGQSNAPLAAWHGGAGGMFAFSTAIVPAVVLDVERLAFVDADGDFDPDLAIAVAGAPPRLLVARDGRLEDQSYVRLPAGAPAVHALAIADWDDACPPDAVLASDAGAPLWSGGEGGLFAADATILPAANDVVLVDVDDDGRLDAVLATSEGAQWLAR